MSEKQVLIVDDDRVLRKLMETVLTREGFDVQAVADGQEALRVLYRQKPDLVLLDVVLPGINGWQTCARIRDVSDVPVIFLTGQLTTEDDIVHGLDVGADEYLLKPVGNKELVARVRAVLRRAEAASSSAQAVREDVFSDSFLTVDINSRRVMVRGEKVRLTPREFRLLAMLMENAGQVMTHRQILESVWGWEYLNDVDYVRIYVAHLRKKMEPEPGSPRYIITEPGVGYYFAGNGAGVSARASR